MRAPIDSSDEVSGVGASDAVGAGVETVSVTGAEVDSGEGVLGALSGTCVVSAEGASVGETGAAESDGFGVGDVAWAGIKPPSKSVAETSTASSRTNLLCSFRIRFSPRVCTREFCFISPRYKENLNP